LHGENEDRTSALTFVLSLLDVGASTLE